MENLFDNVADPAQAALQQWEEGQIQLAIQLLWKSPSSIAWKWKQATKCLMVVFAAKGCRVSVLPDGNCQFRAVIQSGKLSLSVAQLRQEVVKYLTPLGQLFREKMEERFRGKWSLYLKHIEKEGSWGDSLTLLALAHVLRRPIKVVTDSMAQEKDQYMLLVHDLVHPDSWGPELIITCAMDKHFDAVA